MVYTPKTKARAIREIKKRPQSFWRLSEALRDDKDVVMRAVADGYNMEFVSERLRNDKDVALLAVAGPGMAIQWLSDELKDDKDVALAAVSNNNTAASHISDRLKDDKDVALVVVTYKDDLLLNWPWSSEWISERLKNDKDVALEAVSRRGECIKDFSKDIKDDKDVVLAAIASNPGAFRHASLRLKDNKDVALAAIGSNPVAFQHASLRLKDNKDVALAAVKNLGHILVHVSSRLQEDEDVVWASLHLGSPIHHLKFASPKLLNSLPFMLRVVSTHENSTQFASERLRNKKEFLLAAMKKDKNAIKHTSAFLKDNKEVILAAIHKDAHCAMECASESMKMDKDIALAAVTQDGECLKYTNPVIRSNKDCVIAAATKSPGALKYAAGGLNQDPDCLVAAGIWDDLKKRDDTETNSVRGEERSCWKRTWNWAKKKLGHDQTTWLGPVKNNTTDRKVKVVLSTRFSLSAESSEAATQFTVRFKDQPYIKQNNFVVYSPNSFDKQTCDPEWTRFDWPCRGTFETCQREPAALKTGPPSNESCWRYSFRYQLQEAKEGNGFMIQVIELRESQKDGRNGTTTEGYDHIPGQGQAIESYMARDVGIKVFRIYQSGVYSTYHKTYTDLGWSFDQETIEKLVKCIKVWYKKKCRDMTEVDVKAEV